MRPRGFIFSAMKSAVARTGRQVNATSISAAPRFMATNSPEKENKVPRTVESQKLYKPDKTPCAATVPSAGQINSAQRMSDGNLLKRSREATLLDIPQSLPPGEAKRMKLVPAASFADVLVHMKAKAFGVTEQGHPICAHLTGFKPYFYHALEEREVPIDLPALVAHLNAHIPEQPIFDIEVAERRLEGDEGPKEFLKISVYNSVGLSATINFIKQGKLPSTKGVVFKNHSLFESNLDYVFRFMSDFKLAGMSWMEIPANRYVVKPQSEQITSCVLEVEIKYDDSLTLFKSSQSYKVAPLRILSFDIEILKQSPKPRDYNQLTDQVIQIGCFLTRHGEKEPFVRSIFLVGTCSPIANVEIHSYTTEAEMLLAWTKFVRETDPDVLIGFNQTRYDIPYISRRAKLLKIPCVLGRIKDLTTTDMDITSTTTRPYITRPPISGRMQLDLLQHVEQAEGKRKKLAVVAEQWLGDTKLDIDYEEIPRLQKGNADDRRSLALYCLKDSYLPQRLLDKRQVLESWIFKALHEPTPFNVSSNPKFPQLHVEIPRSVRNARAQNYLCGSA
ncbi:ribonuclease H-like domain-containing protein [Mycena floridula]|nr:ribonuclease H-like domain-containing protein [Mycena floridula]